MALFKREELNNKRAIELGFFILGTLFFFITLEFDRPLLAMGGFIIALGPFIFTELFVTDKARDEFTKQHVEVRLRLDRIDQYLKASAPDKLTIAIFDRLLIYLPMYVADSLGYLDQEGIAVDFISKYGDEQVAQAIKSSEVDIGLCDPCMCARAEFSHPGDRLFIIAPIVTSQAAQPVTKHELRIRTRLLQGGNLSIATFPAPSTTFVMAANLLEDLKNRNQAKRVPILNISLENIPAKQFEEFKIAHLYNLLDRYDLVMLWDPFLALAKLAVESSEFHLDAQDSSPNNLMYSALVISERLLDEKPTLGLRLFRAISRATYAIRLAANDEKLLDEIVREISRIDSFQLDSTQLKSLIRDMASGSLFPLIDSPKQMQAAEWREQLYRAIAFRRRAATAYGTNFKETLVPVNNADDCRRFFCKKSVFESTISAATVHT